MGIMGYLASPLWLLFLCFTFNLMLYYEGPHWFVQDHRPPLDAVSSKKSTPPNTRC